MTDRVPMPAHVTMSPIASSHHRAAGYDEANNHLYVDFARPGSEVPNIYRYNNFTPADWNAYQASDSKGQHFLRNIKPLSDKYPFAKVAP